MLTLWYSEETGFKVNCMTTADSDVRLPGLSVTEGAAAKLRHLLGVPSAPPGLTEEQAEVARLEAELEQAWKDWSITSYQGLWTKQMGWHYHVWWPTPLNKETGGYWSSGGDTRLEAVRKAAAYVRTLKPPVPALPPVEEMTGEAMHTEMVRRSWAWYSGSGSCGVWVRNGVALERTAQECAQSILVFLRRALTESRALDAKEEENRRDG
jgi:hypothetical protein